MKKFLRALIGGGLVLGVIAVAAASLMLGRVVKTGIETFGPRVLGAPVTLTGAAISPLSGTGVLHGLVIGNPEGYAGPVAVSAASVEIKVDVASLWKRTIVIERLAVREPRVVWELGTDGASNITRLQRDAEAYAARYGASAPAAGGSSETRSLQIKDLEVTGGQVGLSAAAFGTGTLNAPLPDIRLSNLGGPGRSPAQVAAEALAAVTGSAGQAVGGIGSRTLNQAADAARAALGAFFRRGGK